MNAPIFILPTNGPRTYRGKFPARPRSVSHGATGLHVELNDGTRLWTAKADALPGMKDDCAEMLARAVVMTAEQYADLRAAADMLRNGGDKDSARAAALSIKADSRQYAKRNAEAARREVLAAEGTRYGFDAERPFRVRNRTPQFSGSFDFATLAEARAYRDAQLARRDSVVAGAAPVGPDSNSQCPMSSFILWADGTETLGDIGWTPPADGSARWIAPVPAAEVPATAEPVTMGEAIAASIPGNPVQLAWAERAEVRRDNVEYHAGRKARRDGVAETDCPYLAGGERAARWALGWSDADASERDAEALRAAADAPHVVTGRSVDGAEYFAGTGWSGDYRAALVMSPADAAEIAKREETKAAATRSPDAGVYRIKAALWTGPRLYSVAEYERDEAEAAALESYLANN